MYTYPDVGCGPTDNLISSMFSKLCDPNKEVTSCPGVRFTPVILQQFSHVFLLLSCTQLSLYLLHGYAFNVQIIRPLPNPA